MKIKFTKSPTGAFNLAHNIGEVADIKDVDLAKKLIDTGFAIPVTDSDKKETATSKAKKEKR